LVVAIVEARAADERSVDMTAGGALLTLFTRPTITAPPEPDTPTLVGPAGVMAVPASPPHAAEMVATATTVSRPMAVATVEFIRFLLLLLVGTEQQEANQSF
jgi:hypothetical protein